MPNAFLRIFVAMDYQVWDIVLENTGSVAPRLRPRPLPRPTAEGRRYESGPMIVCFPEMASS